MKIFSVSQINRLIKDLIDNEIILEDIIVTGELSSFSITRNIAYFTLKDNDNLLSCVQFNAKQDFKIGDMVQCRGNIKYYPKGGKLTLNALNIEQCGQGELYQQFLQLKEKLSKEGLFDDINKIPIPRYIKSIGVVTSKTGAVLQDIKNVTGRRNPNLEIYVYDAQVQGKFAVNDVIQGITYFDNMTDVDVIIVARGGGSIEDLAPFNNEELARVAYICNKPLISAVGHETDFTILDFVSDLRAPTPSAAAELVTFDLQELKRYIKDKITDLSKLIDNYVLDLYNKANLLTLEIEKDIKEVVNDEILHINDLMRICDSNLENIINNSIYRVNISINTLDKLNPIKLLSSGYAYATKDNQIINADNTFVGDKIKIITKDAKFMATINQKEKV
ncbi:MAG: exodeoxyribonuclease VII large subunit [Clostridia bacterium]|nr:exodeoxyribonuclease VII large subunit [Clostridia bacterium]